MIKYPNKINPKNKNKQYGNRGMTLESELNVSNKYYLETNKAVIYKKPTPVKVIKQINAKIVDAYFEKPSTTDYNGLYKGKYIDFEAKETQNVTSFPLRNIHDHQINHMKHVINHKGICFLIIRFTKLNKTFLLPAKILIDYIETETRKSIPLEFFEKKAYIIKDKLAPRIDYLEIIDKCGGNLNEG